MKITDLIKDIKYIPQESLWEGEIPLGKEMVRIILDVEPEVAKEDLREIEKVVNFLKDNSEKLYNEILKEMFSLYNDEWRFGYDENGKEFELPALNKRQFLEKIKPVKVNYSGDGMTSMYFSSADLFGDHLIEVFHDRGKITVMGLAG